MANIKVEVSPDTSSLEWWLRENGLGHSQLSGTNWIQNITRGLIAFQYGDFTRARLHARAAFEDEASDITQSRIAALLLCRIASSSGELEEELLTVEEILLHRSGGQESNPLASWGIAPLGPYFRGRIAAMKVIGSEAKTQAAREEQARILNKRLEDCQYGGDVATEAILENAWGVFAVRVGHYRRATYHLQKAALLSSAIGDLFTLGGAVVNLAIAIMRSAPEDDRGAAQQARNLVAQSIELDRRLSFGRNSSQAQVLHARIATFLGELEVAAQALQDAMGIVNQTGNQYDLGYALEAEAKYVWAQVENGVTSPAIGRPIIDDRLVRSGIAFKNAGRSAAGRIKKQLAQFRSGGGLSLSPLG